jgi:hypothetical protein
VTITELITILACIRREHGDDITVFVASESDHCRSKDIAVYYEEETEFDKVTKEVIIDDEGERIRSERRVHPGKPR